MNWIVITEIEGMPDFEVFAVCADSSHEHFEQCLKGMLSITSDGVTCISKDQDHEDFRLNGVTHYLPINYYEELTQAELLNLKLP